MKVLVCGSREWTNVQKIREHLESLPPDTVIVHGAAQGADTIAGNLAREIGFTVREHPSDWFTLGRFAGPVRNAQMLKDEHPDTDGVPIDVVLAFLVHGKNKNRGTTDIIKKAQAVKIPVVKVMA